MADPGCHRGNLNAGSAAHLGGRLAPSMAGSLPATPSGSAFHATPASAPCPDQEFRKARTASTRRLSSADGARSSLVKMLVLCLPTAFSVMHSRCAIALLERP